MSILDAPVTKILGSRESAISLPLLLLHVYYCAILAIVVPCSIIILQVISVYCHLCTSLLESPPTKDKIQAHTQQRWFYDCQCRHRSLLRQKDRGSLRKAASPSQTFKSVSPKQTQPVFKSAHRQSH